MKTAVKEIPKLGYTERSQGSVLEVSHKARNVSFDSSLIQEQIINFFLVFVFILIFVSLWAIS